MSRMFETAPRHPNFEQVEASRPDWEPSSHMRFVKTFEPNWQFGDGANGLAKASKAGGEDKPAAQHVAIDPYEQGRDPRLNYKFLISSVTPRPIALLSTRSKDGSSENMAPFSFFNVLSHDPPIFVVSIVSSIAKPKDSLRNILESGECVINIISDHYVEAANATCANTPYGVSEWELSGLTPARDCKTVACARAQEAVASIEAKLESTREIERRSSPGDVATTVVFLEGTHFWAREDAIDEEKSLVDPAVLQPVGRLGGISYTRAVEAFEIPRKDFEKDVGGMEGLEKAKKRANKTSL